LGSVLAAAGCLPQSRYGAVASALVLTFLRFLFKSLITTGRATVDAREHLGRASKLYRPRAQMAALFLICRGARPEPRISQ
jgi:hypothetical protein